MPGKRNTRLRDSERLLKQSDNIPNTILCMDLLSHCCRSLPHGLIRDHRGDGLRKCLGAQVLLLNGLRTKTTLADLSSPEGLIADKGNNERRKTSAQPGSRGAGAAVMDHRRDPWKEPVVRHSIDGEDRRSLGHMRDGSPTGEQDAPLPAAPECADHLFCEAPFIGSPHTAKANIHRLRPSLEKGLQIGGRGPGRFGVEEPIARDMAKVGPVRWPR